MKALHERVTLTVDPFLAFQIKLLFLLRDRINRRDYVKCRNIFGYLGCDVLIETRPIVCRFRDRKEGSCKVFRGGCLKDNQHIRYSPSIDCCFPYWMIVRKESLTVKASRTLCCVLLL